MFDAIEDAINEIKKGNFVVVLDDEDRENEGDLILAAEKVTAEKLNFMIKYARGLICVPICKERLEELKIGLMVDEDIDIDEAAFTVSVDYIGSGTGISAEDRALTIKKLVDKNTVAEDFLRPGHIFPLKAQCKGILEREGHTEATIDLVKLAGLYPAGVLCEILNDDGTMARKNDLLKYAKKYNFKIITIKDLKSYIKQELSLVVG